MTAATTTLALAVTRLLIDEDTNSGIFSVQSACNYRVVIARNGKIQVTGAGVNWTTSRESLRAKGFDLLGLAALAVLTWERSPTPAIPTERTPRAE